MLCMIFFGVGYILIALLETNFDDLIWYYMDMEIYASRVLGVMG